jgi:MerR family transcriptional regulator/heat shock protein HspR
MNERFIPRDLVASNLGVSTRVLLRYEQLGLVQVTRNGPVEGYEPAQVRRLWSIMSFHRDLGVNLAGVQVILQLCDKMSELHQQLDHLAGELRSILENEDGPDQKTPSSQV